MVFPNGAIAAGKRVGVTLMSGGTPLFTLFYEGDVPLGQYQYDDANFSGGLTGQGFLYQTFSVLTFTLTSATTYDATFGTGIWSGTLAGGAIDAIQVFDNAQIGGGDVYAMNLSITSVPEPSSAALALAGAAAMGLLVLRRRRSGRSN